MYASSGATCNLHFWQNDRGLSSVQRSTSKLSRIPQLALKKHMKAITKITTAVLSLSNIRQHIQRSQQIQQLQEVGSVKHLHVYRLKVDNDFREYLVYGGGGGFFLACEDFGRMFDNSFPACAVFLFFFYEVEISSRTLIPLFRPGSVHSGSAS